MNNKANNLNQSKRK